MRVKGERGTFVWQYATIVGEYVEHTVVGGCGGRKAYRTFTPERIIKRRRQNVEA